MRLVKYLSLLFILTLSMANAFPKLAFLHRQTTNNNSTLIEIKKLRHQRQFEKAIQLGKNHLKVAPKDVDVMLLLGSIYYDQKQFGEAQNYLNQVIAMTPSYLEARLILIRIAIDEKNYVKASTLIAQAEKISPKDKRLKALKTNLITLEKKDAFTAKLKALREDGKLEEAIGLSKTHLKATPNDVDVMLLIGLMYYDQKQYQEANIHLNQVVKLSPDYLEAYLILVKIAIIEKDYVKASDFLKQAREYFPNNKSLQGLQKKLSLIEADVGVTFLSMKKLKAEGKLNEAIALGQAHLKSAPYDVDVMLLIGLMYVEKKEYKKAKLYLNNVLIISPNYIEAQKALARVSIAKKQFQKALLLLNNKKPSSDMSSDSKKIASKKSEKKNVITLEDIKAAKKRKQLDEAIRLGKAYLIKYPKDVDVLLIMGVIFTQKKDYAQAVIYLKKVLSEKSDYADASIALINVRLAEKKYQEADRLLKILKKESPKTPGIPELEKKLFLAKEEAKLLELVKVYKGKAYKKAIRMAKQLLIEDKNDLAARSILADSYFMTRRYEESKKEYLILLKLKPNSKKLLKPLIQLELAMGDTRKAQLLVRECRKRFPKDAEFLAQQSEIDFILHQYARTADTAKKVLREDPSNKTAKYLLKDIRKLSPHLLYGVHAAGGYSDIVYVSDLKASWQYSHLYYNKNTYWGLLSTNLNNASRFGLNANQGVLNLVPILNKYVFVDILGAYANQPRLFPTFVVGGEAYYAGLPIVISGGRYHSSILPGIAFDKITGSLSAEWGKYWLSFRPNYYKPRSGPESLLYTATILRYFEDQDTNVRINLGTGTSPDLANFLTVDFIVVRMKIISANLQFPLFKHRLLFTMGGNYQHWIFPSGKIREISGGLVGLNYRFEGVNG